MMQAARERFSKLVEQSDDAIDVAEVALHIAQEEYPDLDIASYLRRFDDIAGEAAPLLAPLGGVAERVERFNRFLFVEQGFSGNNDDYYDPRNSFLNDVLDRRKGIPISLSVVYCELARRVGMEMHGVSFPGHFLVGHSGDPEIYVDPFFGKIITRRECAQRLSNLYGSQARLRQNMLAPASPREILVRMLGNLKQIYIERSDFVRALSCSDRILLVSPDAPLELRDRGILYQRLECYAAAVRDLERFLELAPDDPTAATVHEALPDIYRQAALVQ